MKRPLPAAALAALLAAGALAAGCRNAEDQRAAEVAKDALGIQSSDEKTTGVAKRKVIVEETVRVVDAQDGTVLSEKQKKTPVEVDTQIKKKVEVNVGNAQTAQTGKAE